MPGRGGARSPIATRTDRSPTPSCSSGPAILPAIWPISGLRPARRSRSCCRIRCNGSRPAWRSRAPAPSSVPISVDATEPEIAYRLSDASCRAIVTTGERSDLGGAAARESAEPFDRDRHRRRRRRRRRSALRAAGDDGAEVGAARSRRDARPRLHSVHVGNHRPGQGRRSDRPRHAVGHGRLLGADHRTERARHHAVAAAAVSFLRAEPVGAQHPGDRRQRYIMERFSTSEAVRLLETGEFTYFPGVPTMFHYLLQATHSESDAKLPESAGLRLGRRDHAGDAQPRVRAALRQFRCSTATASPKPRPW